MKKLSKALVLLVAVMMLFASCSPDSPTKTPDKPSVSEIDTFPWKKVEIDPNHPYDALHFGLFHDQNVTVDKSHLNGVANVPCDVSVKYSIYIPENAHPKTPVVLVLTPDNTTAKAFALSDIGQQWIEQAHEHVFGVAFVEPAGGKTWNIDPKFYVPEEAPAETAATFADYPGYPGWGGDTKPKAPRDERIAIYQVVQAIRSKSITADRAYMSADKNSFGVVGYGEGATAATIAAAAWPQVFANIVAVEPVDFPAEAVKTLLDMNTFRHNDEYSGASAENPIPARTIPMPMYVVKGSDAASANAIVDIWKDVNKNALREDSSAEEKYYVSELISDKSVENLASLAIMNVRPRGYAGGTLRTRTDMWNDRGYEMNEARINKDKGDDRLHRWAIYTPENLDESKPVPVVLVLHGSTASITDIVDESKWSNVADENGFIVAYAQGYAGSGATHAPSWSSSSQADIDFLLSIVDDVASKHNVDRSRVYITGHSLGAMMIGGVLRNEEACKTFAAYAPVGAGTGASDRTPDVELAVYNIMGEWEFRGEATGASWAQRFGITETPEPEFLEGYTAGKYKTWTYVDENGNVPVKLTQVMDSPHVYMAEEAEIIWDWFEHISRNQETLKLEFSK